ncbi:putative integral membrane protein [Neisseria gonorrhoeae]|uniref:Putative integral membrane protein n=1 Tax=Neisseria gonorrhoeae TaxID=485 RepID=A0A378VTI9_NEIGO|nr:putative integral membrane protein [Neisseria gonorrhoeae]
MDRRGETAKPARLRAPAPDYLGGMTGGVMMVWLTAGLWHSGFTKLDYPKLCRIAVSILSPPPFARCFNERESDILHHRSRDSDRRRVHALPADVRTDFRANAFTDDPE